ncbi:unnamed protein product [Prorocentrum cordatum]|uniref:Uncharacterized protein n=1 Tax=Prorocentrum cordatum TaxID=2364126 RepID=A0ABN9X0K2_9DINO|nr:unnamed protein product [Polarella glacialis]
MPRLLRASHGRLVPKAPQNLAAWKLAIRQKAAPRPLGLRAAVGIPRGPATATPTSSWSASTVEKATSSPCRGPGIAGGVSVNSPSKPRSDCDVSPHCCRADVSSRRRARRPSARLQRPSGDQNSRPWHTALSQRGLNSARECVEHRLTNCGEPWKTFWR